MLSAAEERLRAVGGLPRKLDGTVDYSRDFFSVPSYLTVSGQLQGEMYACGMSNVYTFGPTFRAENSHTVRLRRGGFWVVSGVFGCFWVFWGVLCREGGEGEGREPVGARACARARARHRRELLMTQVWIPLQYGPLSTGP